MLCKPGDSLCGLKRSQLCGEALQGLPSEATGLPRGPAAAEACGDRAKGERRGREWVQWVEGTEL